MLSQVDYLVQETFCFQVTYTSAKYACDNFAKYTLYQMDTRNTSCVQKSMWVLLRRRPFC
jgi:hypothetical protein